MKDDDDEEKRDMTLNSSGIYPWELPPRDGTPDGERLAATAINCQKEVRPDPPLLESI